MKRVYVSLPFKIFKYIINDVGKKCSRLRQTLQKIISLFKAEPMYEGRLNFTIPFLSTNFSEIILYLLTFQRNLETYFGKKNMLKMQIDHINKAHLINIKIFLLLTGKIWLQLQLRILKIRKKTKDKVDSSLQHGPGFFDDIDKNVSYCLCTVDALHISLGMLQASNRQKQCNFNSEDLPIQFICIFL